MIVFYVLPFFSSLAFSNPKTDGNDFLDKITNVEDMLINWTQLRLELQNTSDIDGSLQLKESTACQEINDQFHEYTLSIPITSESVLYDLVQKDENLQGNLRRELNNWVPKETIYIQEPEEVRVVGHLNLQAYLQPLILESARNFVPSQDASPYSGVIIDARTSSFHPVLFPEILYSDGNTFLDINSFSKIYARTSFPVRYVTDPADELVSKTVGSSPIFFTSSKLHNNNLVVDQQHNAKIQKELENAIAKGKVVIVIQ